MKIQLKLSSNGKSYWTHLCYIPKNLVLPFLQLTQNITINTLVTRWAKEDFEIDTLKEEKDLNELRKSIKEHYKKLYPKVYTETFTDSQGWIRIWCTEHLMKEMEIDESNSR